MQETAQKYDVVQMPTFLLIRGGNVVDRFAGANAALLRQKLQDLQAETGASDKAPEGSKIEETACPPEEEDHDDDASGKATMDQDTEGSQDGVDAPQGEAEPGETNADGVDAAEAAHLDDTEARE